MATETRDQILANFMQCTNSNDYGECIEILERNDWNFQRAIDEFRESTDATFENNQHSDDRYSPPSSFIPRSTFQHPRHRQIDEDHDAARILPSYRAPPSSIRPQRSIVAAAATASGRSVARELNFTVQHNDQSAHIKLHENQTVYNLREKIRDTLHIPVQQQKILTWTTKSFNDRTPLKDMKLDKDNQIRVIATESSIVPGRAPGASPSRSTTRSSQPTRHHRAAASPGRVLPVSHNNDFPITVKFDDTSGRTISYELVLRPTATIAELKTQMETHSKIPVNQQVWRDLKDVADTETLRESGLQRRSVLTLRRRELPSEFRSMASSVRAPERPSRVRPVPDVDLMEIDSNDDETPDIIFDDQSAILAAAAAATTTNAAPSDTRELLIPDGTTNDIVALENFNRVFHFRYQGTGPFLFIGSLDEAIKTSLFGPLFDRRPLAIYLHDDRSICANVFCTQVLCSDTIIDYLSNNFIVWAWDMTGEKNRKRFIEVLKNATNLQHFLRMMPQNPNSFPLLLVLQRNRGKVEISNIIEGQQTCEEVLVSLTQSRELFAEQQQRDAEEEMERESRERLRQQQEEEYNHAVKIDMAKDRVRQMDDIKRLDEARRTKDLEEKRSREQQESQNRLIDEPAENEPHITKFKIRLPDQRILLRRFRMKETLENLFDYLSSEGQLFGEYRLLTAQPRRELTTLNPKVTLGALELQPQQLIVEKI